MSFTPIFLLIVTSILLQQTVTLIIHHDVLTCNRTCGGKTVDYPFGFSGSCEVNLTCSNGGKIGFQGYNLRNLTWETISVDIPTKCNRTLEELRVFFTENSALTTRNEFVLRNCSSKTTRVDSRPCVVSASLFEGKFRICDGNSNSNSNSSINVSCFDTRKTNNSVILRSEDIANIECKNLVSSIVVVNDDNGDGLDISIVSGAVQVQWWLTGTCNCDANATCNRVGSDGYQCRCNDGFIGDGFVNGQGCRNASSSDVLKHASGGIRENKIAILVGGILAGACSTLILVIICYFCRRRSTYVRRHVSAKRLLFEAAGNSTVRLYPYRDIERATNNFCEKQLLGTGAYGTVYVGKLHHDECVAIKKIKHRDTESIEQVMNEIKLLSSVSHPNLVRLLGCCIENGEQILVYEYMPNGTLSQHLQRERGKGLPWTVRLTIASETAQAISFLHSTMNPPIFHRDIKSSNILLDFEYRSKVADFGLSRLGLEEMSHISTAPQGTPGYVDPQYHQNFHLSDKSDVYSFGVVLVEIITSMKVVDFTRPHLEVNLAALAVDRIGKGQIDEIIDPFIELHRDAWTLASVHKIAELAFRCLAYHRDMRPSMVEVAHELEQIRLSGWVSLEENICMGSSISSTCSSPFNGSERSFNGISTRRVLGSQRVILPQKPIDHLAALEEVRDGSPVSVRDSWFSEQSSPSSNSLLGNVTR